MRNIRFNRITYPDVNNGLGCRVTLWLQGCDIQCPGCHNKHLWDKDGGRTFTERMRRVLWGVLGLEYIDGITICGGEPMMQWLGLYDLLKEIRKDWPSKNIWLYTGYTMEDIIFNPLLVDGLVDVIVDGPYIEKERDISLPFRGSRNQHIWKRYDWGGNVCKYVIADDDFD